MSDAEELPEELIIKLRKPLEQNGETFAELRLREPTVGELKEAMKKDGLDVAIELIWKITGILPGALAKLGIRDMNQAQRYLMGFIEDGQ